VAEFVQVGVSESASRAFLAAADGEAFQLAGRDMAEHRLD
jgi:hypothetical protein